MVFQSVDQDREDGVQRFERAATEGGQKVAFEPADVTPAIDSLGGHGGDFRTGVARGAGKGFKGGWVECRLDLKGEHGSITKLPFLGGRGEEFREVVGGNVEVRIGRVEAGVEPGRDGAGDGDHLVTFPLVKDDKVRRGSESEVDVAGEADRWSADDPHRGAEAFGRRRGGRFDGDDFNDASAADERGDFFG
jgi:hypothetical protein